jgi:hypothetical protein
VIRGDVLFAVQKSFWSLITSFLFPGVEVIPSGTSSYFANRAIEKGRIIFKLKTGEVTRDRIEILSGDFNGISTHRHLYQGNSRGGNRKTKVLLTYSPPSPKG